MANGTDKSSPAIENNSAPGNRAEILLSVALVTRNRPESLERCLKSWRSQTVSPLEIVVSDDSDDEYCQRIKDLAARFDCIYTQGPRRGLYANRNNAALNCRGSHVLSADDDHTHPTNYIEQAIATVSQDPNRVWIFAERSPHTDPGRPPGCPPELHRSGAGIAPSDPSDCSAIADGSSVYPRKIFDDGLRYDETYRFGSIWYLWGKVLVANGWRISFSDATFIEHHEDTEDRLRDIAALKQQLECMTYVIFVNALWINPGITNLFWAYAYLMRRLIFTDSVAWFKVRSRLDLPAALRLLYLAFTYPLRVGRVGQRSGTTCQ